MTVCRYMYMVYHKNRKLNTSIIAIKPWMQMLPVTFTFCYWTNSWKMTYALATILIIIIFFILISICYWFEWRSGFKVWTRDTVKLPCRITNSLYLCKKWNVLLSFARMNPPKSTQNQLLSILLMKTYSCMFLLLAALGIIHMLIMVSIIQCQCAKKVTLLFITRNIIATPLS